MNLTQGCILMPQTIFKQQQRTLKYLYCKITLIRIK